MDKTSKLENSYRKKYAEDMSEIIRDMSALQNVVDTLVKVSDELELGNEMESCLTIVKQSVDQIASSIKSKLQKAEETALGS